MINPRWRRQPPGVLRKADFWAYYILDGLKLQIPFDQTFLKKDTNAEFLETK